MTSRQQPLGYSINNFHFSYLYGFTNNPERSSNDNAAFSKLFRLVIGNTGGGFYSQSFHPYYLVNAKGTSAWIAAYAYLFTSPHKEEIWQKISNDAAIYKIEMDSSFATYNPWPDNRIDPSLHPDFGRYVPFVIPFLVWNDNKSMRWHEEISAAIATTGHAGEYLKKVNDALRFLMPEPSFVIGFEEFDDQNPFAMIDHFVDYMKVIKG